MNNYRIIRAYDNLVIGEVLADSPEDACTLLVADMPFGQSLVREVGGPQAMAQGWIKEKIVRVENLGPVVIAKGGDA